MKLISIPEKFYKAAEFIDLFKMTKLEIKTAPNWELNFVLKRGEEEKIDNLKEFIEFMRGGKI